MDIEELIEASRYRFELTSKIESKGNQQITTDDIQSLLNAINKLSLSFTSLQSSTSQRNTSNKNEVVDVLYKVLDELGEIKDILGKQVPLGKVVNIPNGLSITAGDTYIDFIKGLVNYPNNTKLNILTFGYPLFSISIENEGANNCIIVINPDESWGRRTINNGETYELDMKKAVIKGLKISVATGESCTVQISGVV